jgi:predicted GNAT superfamily acetyltransferase
VANVSTDAPSRQACALLEIPEQIGRLRSEAPEVAERWRKAVAEAFTTLFARGFKAVDFLRIKTADASRGFYVLRRESPPS